MHSTNVIEHTHLRTGNLTQLGNLTRHVETHFQHSILVAGGKSQHAQRQAYLVIKVCGTFQRNETLAEYLRDRFLRGRLANATCDTHHPQRQLRTPERGNLLKGRDSVFHQDTYGWIDSIQG